jgi:hypothetical protein
MKITCPFCGIAGEMPDHLKLKPKPIRCRQCGTRFHSKPLAIDDPAEHAIDVDHLTRNAPLDIGVRLDDKPSTYRPTRTTTQQSSSTESIKLFITIAAVLWNCGLILMYGYGMTDDIKNIRDAGNNSLGVTTNGTGWNREVVTLSDAKSTFMLHIVVLGFIASLPLLGSYISYAKHRGPAEGYGLVTFFGPLGLIVALCLPTNREHE